MKQWEYLKIRTKSLEGYSLLNEKLKEGWEPFAVVKYDTSSYYGDEIHLKREVIAKSVWIEDPRLDEETNKRLMENN
jgi:hypothetical protein